MTTKAGAPDWRMAEALDKAAEEESFELWASTARPCRSIHCRHYDLASDLPCMVEVARARANRKQQ